MTSTELENALFAETQAKQALQQEIERLTKCLISANANHEQFERQYYLELNNVEQLRSEIESIKKVPVVSDEQIENIIYQCDGYLNWGVGTQGKKLICEKIREIIGGKA